MRELCYACGGDGTVGRGAHAAGRDGDGGRPALDGAGGAGQVVLVGGTIDCVRHRVE